MNIAIVNDVWMIRALLTKIIHDHTDHKVIWDAEDGQDAVYKAQKQTPDLILMDLLMPVMDGVEATQIIMQTSPCAIVVVTASVEKYADMVFSAMSHGALDAISTPSLDSNDDSPGINPLLHKLRVISNLIDTRPRNPEPAKKPIAKSGNRGKKFPMVCIGASTGGPGALAIILAGLPVDLNASIVIVQHVDENFVQGLAEWLDTQCKLPVTVAKEGESVAINHVYIAGGDKHLRLDPSLSFEYSHEPVEYAYRPSIDIFFHCINQYWPGSATGVLLTGMGNDGADGLLALKNNNCITIAQDEKTCAVYGMPRAAARLDAASLILPIDGISTAIIKSLSSNRSNHIKNVQSAR